jgi:hypothetical protein
MTVRLPAGTYTIQEGESLASLAESSGFFEATLWNWPDNAHLHEGRRRSSVLAPGDAVVIPQLRQKEATKSTDARHVFRRHGIPAVYRLRLLHNLEPVARARYTFTVNGKESWGTTDEEGCLEEIVPPGARQGLLVVERIGLRARVRFGYLDPIGVPGKGVEKRLSNLGYLAPQDNGDAAKRLRRALRAFQLDHDLPVTEEADEATIAALEKAHDFQR